MKMMGIVTNEKLDTKQQLMVITMEEAGESKFAVKFYVGLRLMMNMELN